MIRLDKELMKSFEKLTYIFLNSYKLGKINVKLKNRESPKKREKQLVGVFLDSWNLSRFLHAKPYN